MTTEDKKEVLEAVIVLAVISFIVVSSSFMDFQLIDAIYLIVIGYSFLNYLYQKMHHI